MYRFPMQVLADFLPSARPGLGFITLGLWRSKVNKTATSKTMSCRAMILAILAAALALPAAAAPPDWFDTTTRRGWPRNLPDFFQHQPAFDETAGSTGLIEIPLPYPDVATNPIRIRWQGDNSQFGTNAAGRLILPVGGYCGAAAILDTMYQWNESLTFRGLIRDANIRVANAWLTPANNNIFYNHFSGSVTGGQGILVNSWFNTLGFGADNVGVGGALGYREAQVQQTNVAAAGVEPARTAGEVRFKSARAGVNNPVIMTTRDINDDGAGVAIAARPITAIEFYKQQLVDNGYTANIRVAATAAGADARLWWRGAEFDGGNFHLVAGAGIDTNNATRRIYIADPDSNKGNQGANAGITGNKFAAIGAVAAAAPQPAIAAGKALKVDSARKHNFANLADQPVPIPGRVVALDGSTRVLAADFDCYYGFWDMNADGFTITGSDNAGAGADPAPGRYAGVTIRALGITSTLNVGVGLAVARPGPPGNWDTPVSFTNDILNPIDQVMLFPAQGALEDSPSSFVTADPWGSVCTATPGNTCTGKLIDLTSSPLSPDLSTTFTIGTAVSPMSAYDVFFRDMITGLWTVRSTVDITNDTFYGVQTQSAFGDYNGDETVDAADYVAWRKTNILGQLGYDDWRKNFGHQLSPGGGASDGAVPEPASGALMAVALGVVGLQHRRSRRRCFSPFRDNA